MATRTKERLLYSLFALSAALVFFVVRFPGSEVLAGLDARLKALHPGLSLTAERVSLWPPLGLRLANPVVTGPERQARVLLKAESLYASPRLPDLLRGACGVDFKCAAYNGSIQGQFCSRRKLAGPFDGEIRLLDIDLGQEQSLTVLAGCKILGHAAGVIRLAEVAGLPPAGSGKAELTVTEGRLELAVPVLGMKMITFKELGVTAILADRKVNLTAELKGPEIAGTLAGNVILAADLVSSRLDLKGSMEPSAALLKEKPELNEGLKLLRKNLKSGRYFFTVSGTVLEPRLQMI